MKYYILEDFKGNERLVLNNKRTAIYMVKNRDNLLVGLPNDGLCYKLNTRNNKKKFCFMW